MQLVLNYTGGEYSPAKRIVLDEGTLTELRPKSQLCRKVLDFVAPHIGSVPYYITYEGEMYEWYDEAVAGNLDEGVEA